MKTDSVLEKVLASGSLAVTSECGPPRGADPEVILKKAELLKGYVDAVNVTGLPDSHGSHVQLQRMRVFKAVRHAADSANGHPGPQSTRHPKRRAGGPTPTASTICCVFPAITPHFGDHPMAANVHDIDSLQLLQLMHNMRENGKFQGGDDILNPPKMFIGAAANPFADPFELRVCPPGQKGRRRRGFHSNPVYLQPRQI